MSIHDEIDKAIAAAQSEAHAAGVIEGRKQIGQEANDLVQRERDVLLQQGRDEQTNAMQHLIEEAREEGRVMGVEEGRSVGKMHADASSNKAGYQKGLNDGHKQGYKKGRGEGYRNGWNDCVNTPPKNQKPK